MTHIKMDEKASRLARFWVMKRPRAPTAFESAAPQFTDIGRHAWEVKSQAPQTANCRFIRGDWPSPAPPRPRFRTIKVCPKDLTMHSVP